MYLNLSILNSPQASLSKSQDGGKKLQAPSPMKINKDQRKGALCKYNIYC